MPTIETPGKSAGGGRQGASRQVALLRGINVGRAKRVSMADLRAIVAGLGYDDVRTLLNSGHVVFTASRRPPSDAGRRIQAALLAKAGVDAPVTLLDAAELDAAIEENPLLDIADDPARLLVAVPTPRAGWRSSYHSGAGTGCRRRQRWGSASPISGAPTGSPRVRWSEPWSASCDTR